MKSKSALIITLLTFIIAEIVLYGVNQMAFKGAYSWIYLVIVALYVVLQILFCLNMEKFFTSNSGVRMFFIYKACKFMFIICPLVIYIFVAKEVDIWIPVRASVYYFIFLIEETLMSLKYQQHQ